jgi:hypothetical protein
MWFGKKFIDTSSLSADTVKELERLAKDKDDAFLESSPCENCRYQIYWSYRFCSACGHENEHFDPAYLDGSWECESFHKWLVDFIESTKHIANPESQSHCNFCGLSVV